MKLFNKLNFFILGVLFLSMLNSPASAKNVSGIINTNTVWTKSNSPYIITNTVQIAENVTLTINPGVEIKAKEYGYIIQLWGKINAIGTESSFIKFNSIYIHPLSRTTASIYLQYVEFNEGCPCDRGDEFLNLEIRDSMFINCENYFNSGNIIVERNYFFNNTGYTYYGFLNISNNSSYASIKYNVFNNVGVGIQPSVVFENNLVFNGVLELYAQADGSPVVKNNSFIIEKNSINIGAVVYYTILTIDISNNYWEIKNNKTLDDIIVDRNDSLNNNAFINYNPKLSEPHPETPNCSFIYVNAGKDQTVNEGELVVLDGSKSQDNEFDNYLYLWKQMNVSSTYLFNSSSPISYFIAPFINQSNTTLKLQITVNDKFGCQKSDEISVTIKDTPDPDLFPTDVIPFPTNENEILGIKVDKGSLASVYPFLPAEASIDNKYKLNQRYGLVEVSVGLSVNAPEHYKQAVYTIYFPESLPEEFVLYKYIENTSPNTKPTWIDFSRNKISHGKGQGAEFNSDMTQAKIYILDDDVWDDYMDSNLFNTTIQLTFGLGIPVDYPTDIMPPTSLAAKGKSSTQIALTWKDNSNNETGFKIEKKTGGCTSTNPWTVIAANPANTISDTISGLIPNTTYSFRVRAYNAASNSDCSNCVSAKTGVSGSASSPTKLNATSVSPSKVNLTWSDNSANETGFEIYRKAGAEAWALRTTTGPNIKVFSDATATYNSSTTTYQYYIVASNTSGDSSSTYNAMVPYQPTNLKVAKGTAVGSLILSWTDKSTNETGFEIYWKSGSCSSTSTWAKIPTLGANKTSWTHKGLKSGNTYSYKIRAYKKMGSALPAYGYSMYSNCSSTMAP
jgi:hypothetical protein